MFKKGIFLGLILTGAVIYASAQDIPVEGPFTFQTEFSKPKIELFPNPTVDFLNIQLIGEIPNPTITLHNIIGNKIEVEPEKIADNNFKLNVKELAPGYYLLIVRDQTAKFNQAYKFLKR